MKNKKLLAYIIGVSIGDGNLSNPNGRAIRLRITCDNKYPVLRKYILRSLSIIFPKNKVTEVDRENCTDISIYSNKLENILGWKAKNGPKSKQNVSIPNWILENDIFLKECIRGLVQTDGSIYKDRGYKMVNFTTIIEKLAYDYFKSLESLGYKPQIRKVIHKSKTKYVIRISKDTDKFIENLKIWKN